MIALFREGFHAALTYVVNNDSRRYLFNFGNGLVWEPPQAYLGCPRIVVKYLSKVRFIQVYKIANRKTRLGYYPPNPSSVDCRQAWKLGLEAMLLWYNNAI